MRKGGIAPGLRRHIGGVGSFSLFYKIDRIHSFDIRYSTFCGSTVRFSVYSFDIHHSIFALIFYFLNTTCKDWEYDSWYTLASMLNTMRRVSGFNTVWVAPWAAIFPSDIKMR